jgi:Flp pilus assembly protein TadG
MFALALLPMMVGVGFGVDYAAANREKARLQAALDAGVLAAARQTSRVPDPSDVVTSFVDAAFASSPNGKPTVVASTDSSGTVTGSAALVVRNNFMKLVGQPTVTVNVASQASFSAGKLEVAIVFDATGSMNGSKMSAAQQAASNLVDTLFRCRTPPRT